MKKEKRKKTKQKTPAGIASSGYNGIWNMYLMINTLKGGHLAV